MRKVGTRRKAKWEKGVGRAKMPTVSVPLLGSGPLSFSKDFCRGTAAQPAVQLVIDAASWSRLGSQVSERCAALQFKAVQQALQRQNGRMSAAHILLKMLLCFRTRRKLVQRTFIRLKSFTPLGFFKSYVAR